MVLWDMNLTWSEALVFLLFVVVVTALVALDTGNGPLLTVALVVGAAFAVLAALAFLFKV
jgi:hypothetical protein